nr:MAG TPA: Aminoglycoside 6-adenylyltransferase [Caudoviricetes sp.]
MAVILYGSKKTSDFDTIIVGTSVSTVSQTV